MLVYPLHVPFFLALCAQICVLLLLFSLLLFYFCEDIVLNQGTHKVKTPTDQLLYPLRDSHSASLICLRPFELEDLVEGSEVMIFDYDLLAYAEAELRVDSSNVLEEKHQLISEYFEGEGSGSQVLLYRNTLDNFLDRELLGNVLKRLSLKLYTLRGGLDGLHVIFDRVLQLVS